MSNITSLPSSNLTAWTDRKISHIRLEVEETTNTAMRFCSAMSRRHQASEMKSIARKFRLAADLMESNADLMEDVKSNWQKASEDWRDLWRQQHDRANSAEARCRTLEEALRLARTEVRTNGTRALVVARSDAAFDGRNYDTLGRADRIRYEQRALAGIAALEAAFGGQP